MNPLSPTSPNRARALTIAAAILAVAIAGGLVATADAERARVLGKSPRTPQPNCSGNDPSECQITGQVTGYQRSIDGKGNPFKARKNGRIVAWSISLARPSQEEQTIFGEASQTDEFGPSPTAGIAIIRKKPKRRFKLMRSSPILRVQNHYGTKPLFTLRRPLRINRGDIVALTTATWLPSFWATDRPAGRDDVWVGSRNRKQCEIPNSVPDDERLDYFFAHTRPHRKKGTTRPYRCTYDHARLLYWAYFAPRRSG